MFCLLYLGAWQPTHQDSKRYCTSVERTTNYGISLVGWLANPSPKIPWYTRLQTAWFRPIPPTHNREPYDTTTVLSNIMMSL